jgi:hypothetical protein
MSDPSLGARFLAEVRMWSQTHDLRADLDWWEQNNPDANDWQRLKLQKYREALDEYEQEDKARWECEAIDRLDQGRERIDEDLVLRLQH